MTTLGYVRVVNYRVDMAPDSQPEADETVIPVDRRNPVLGNRHILKNKLDWRERDRCIDAYARDVDADFAVQGPMYHAINELAERVLNGEKLALQCACIPLRCHGSVIAERINQQVEARLKSSQFGPETKA